MSEITIDLIAKAREHAESLRVVMQDQAAETIESLCEALEDKSSNNVVSDGVWEALQRLIENAQSLGEASQEDALLVARWRGQFRSQSDSQNDRGVPESHAPSQVRFHDEFAWLVELRPAFEGHPPFPATYYAGWMDGMEGEKTQDAFAAPRFLRKEDAEKVAGELLGTLSCAWRAVEHGFATAYQPVGAAPSCPAGFHTESAAHENTNSTP